MGAKRSAQIGWRQLMAVGMLTPLLAFCSGPRTSAATATAQPPAPTEPARSAANAAVATAAAQPAAIYINEVLAHTDEPQVDSLELYNPDDAAVDLTGWCISDDEKEPDRFCIPAGPKATIPAGGYVVYAHVDGELPFGFSEFGEDVYLYAPGAAGLQQVDAVQFGVSPNGVSLGRYVTSIGAVDFPLQKEVTLGAANAGPLIPAVVISEIMYQPAQGPEYLVLTNRSSAAFPLYDPAQPQNRWQVLGIGNNNGEYVLPAQTILQPGESVVLTADPQAFTATYPARSVRIFGPFSGKLDNSGERIILQAPQPPETNGDVAYADMDVVDYGAAAPWPAAGAANQPLVRIDLGGYGNDPANWQARTAAGTVNPVLMLPLVVR